MTPSTHQDVSNHVSNPAKPQLKGAKVQGSSNLSEVMGQVQAAIGRQVAIDTKTAASGLLSDRFDT